jgi:acetyl-CoA carboxylase biotin carboxyl carrier protein
MSEDAVTAELLQAIDRLEGVLRASALVELEVEVGGTTLVLRTSTGLAPAGPAGPAAERLVPVPAHGQAAPLAQTAGVPGVLGATGAATSFHAVVAPLTGVFYGSPSPGAAPYVKVGSEVTSGMVIGLIEAMKLFNEIKSDATGIVRRIAVESGALVKAKQTLIEVEPG